jgi:hypothetical protein
MAIGTAVPNHAEAQTFARSIPASRFTSTVQAAVKSALQKHPKFQMELPKGVTFGYLIRGIPVPERLLANVSAAETQAFADDVAAHIGSAQPEALAGAGRQGAFFATGGHLIVGIPAVEAFTLE